MTARAAIPPQLTAKAIVLGLVLAAALAAANAYLGLFAGLTVSASIPASVISMAVLRLWKRSNILESNVVQTAASAGESTAAGAIFTFPALVLLGYWRAFDYVWVGVIAGLGGLLGVLFTIPLRRALIVDLELAYPEGTATAEVLQVGAAAGRGALQLAGAAALGAIVKLAETGLRIWSETAQTATFVGSSAIAYVGANLSPALLGVGYIVGLNIAMLAFLGGALAWFVAIPLYFALFSSNDPALAGQIAGGADAATVAFAIWGAKIRYLGVGAMLIGGVAAIVSLRGSLFAGIRGGLAVSHGKRSSDYDHTDHDAPMRLVLALVALSTLPIFAVYHAIVGTIGVALAMTLVMLLAAFLFSAVAGYMAGLVGSSNNPISGITIATILLASLLLLWLMGPAAANGPAAAVLVGAVVCCAAAIGGDNLQDLKAGYLLGATPWRLQLAQTLGVVAAVLVMAPILNLLLMAYGIGAPTPDRPNALAAPQANLMASVAQGVFRGGLPWGFIALGVVLGAVNIAFDAVLARRRSSWRAPVLAVAIGIYLPLELTTPILLGGLVAYFAEKRRRTRDVPARHGVVFAAGLITGEALIGVALAIPIVLSGRPDVLALPFAVPTAVGVVMLGLIAAMLYRVATRNPLPA